MLSANLVVAQNGNGQTAPNTSSFSCGVTPEMIKKMEAQNRNLLKWTAPQNTNGALLRGEPACFKVQSTKYIKLHFHYILKNDGTGNFRATDDGYVGTTFHRPGVTGNTYAADAITNANTKMANNYRNYLPQSLSNITPVVPKRLQFILGSVSYHSNSNIYNQGVNIDWNQADALYGAQDRGQSVHVYMVVQDFTSTSGVAQVITRTDQIYPFLAINLNYWLGYRAAWNDGLNGGVGHTLNHEIGHIFGLDHDNGDDGCSDTGEHLSCYSYDPNDPDCGNWANISNNVMMSAGLPWQEALTPCQIDKIQTRLLGNLSSYVEQCVQECAISDPSFSLNIPITTTVCKVSNVIMTLNNASVNNRWKLDVKNNNNIFSTGWNNSTPPTTINVGQLSGINFKKAGPFSITMSTDNFPNCPGIETFQQNLTIYPCSFVGANLKISPNPVSNGNFTVDYLIEDDADVSISLVDQIGNPIHNLIPMSRHAKGHIEKIATLNLRSGIYYIVVNHGGDIGKVPISIAQ
jgi:Metallo-peptidase family M12B Reprolysin-like